MQRTILASLTAGAVALALTATAPAAVASEQTGKQSNVGTIGNIKVIAHGETTTGGWVAFEGHGEFVIDGRATDPLGCFAAQEVGGGVWVDGWTGNGIGQKVCSSEHKHDTVAHGSSMSMDISDSDWVGAGYVSDAYVSSYTDSTCYANWPAWACNLHGGLFRRPRAACLTRRARALSGRGAAGGGCRWRRWVSGSGR